MLLDSYWLYTLYKEIIFPKSENLFLNIFKHDQRKKLCILTLIHSFYPDELQLLIIFW